MSEAVLRILSLSCFVWVCLAPDAVADVLGRDVVTLADGPYFYTLTAGGLTVTKGMMLAK